MKSFVVIWCLTFLCHGICFPQNDTTSQELNRKHNSVAQTLAVGDSHSFCVDSRKFSMPQRSACSQANARRFMLLHAATGSTFKS